METRLMYIELKSGYSDNGPAWIGLVTFSRTKTTIYFNNKSFKKSRGVGSNFYDIETGDAYWISGVKKNGEDRHWAGNGKILIDKKVVDDYLKITGDERLDKSKFEITEIKETRDKKDFVEIENQIKE
ncbi:MAG: hypothetical protein HRU69_13955 [Flammeovirgaceae bacterium]|nr:MAG: hypothetical protein HRU69_13955 [Flammeovirgaceae bacterium]